MQNKNRKNLLQIEKRIISKRLPQDFFPRRCRKAYPFSQPTQQANKENHWITHIDDFFLFTFRRTSSLKKVRTAQTDSKQRQFCEIKSLKDRAKSEKSFKFPLLKMKMDKQKKTIQNLKLTTLNIDSFKKNFQKRSKINNILKL